MCLRTVYYNTYADGFADITERVDPCTPGYVCPHPRVVEYDRAYAVSRERAREMRGRERADRTDRMDQDDRSPARVPRSPRIDHSPRALSPGSGVSTRSHSRTGSASSAASSTHQTFVHAASHATSSPIPIRRSATTGGDRPRDHHHHRPLRHSAFPASPPPRIHYYPLDDDDTRPAVHHRHRRGLSPPAPLPLFEEHRSRASRPVSLSSSAAATTTSRPPPPRLNTTYHGGAWSPSPRSPLLSPTHSPRFPSAPLRSPRVSHDDFLRPPPSPAGYGSAEDEAERAARRRRRRAQRAVAAEGPSSVPTAGLADVFGSSVEDNDTQGRKAAAPSARARIVTPSPSAAAAAATAATTATATTTAVPPSTAAKSLRWEDEMRRQQNARIHQRPKLSREEAKKAKEAKAATATQEESTTQDEVRSILKTSPAASRASSQRPSRASSRSRSSRPSSRPSSRAPSSSTPRHTDDLLASFAGLSVDDVLRPSKEEDAAAAAERDRLSSRFRMPPRRFTAGGAFRRRTEYLGGL